MSDRVMRYNRMVPVRSYSSGRGSDKDHDDVEAELKQERTSKILLDASDVARKLVRDTLAQGPYTFHNISTQLSITISKLYPSSYHFII